MEVGADNVKAAEQLDLLPLGSNTSSNASLIDSDASRDRSVAEPSVTSADDAATARSSSRESRRSRSSNSLPSAAAFAIIAPASDAYCAAASFNQPVASSPIAHG